MTQKISSIIVDDEAKARRILETLIEENCPELKVLDRVEDVPSAVKSINKHKPDIVFLDIEMPNYTGFQLFDFFENPDFEVIFTTAYSNYAVKAFEFSALSYLLKPIEIDQLKRTVEKFIKLGRKSHVLPKRIEVLKINIDHEDHGVQKIALPVSDGLLFVAVEDLLYLKADGAYTEIYLAKGNKVVVSKNLKEFEGLLTNSIFFRTHRSFIVNVKRVKQFIKGDGGYLVMENGDEVSISKDRKEEFIKSFSLPI